MDEIVKRAIKKTILALRKLLEQEDIPAVLKQHGIFPDGRRVPVEKIALLDDTGKSRRTRLEAILEREIKVAGNDPKEGVKRYCREVTFTYINRLIALRCMEVRGLIDECIKTRADYAGRSLRHHRFRREHPHLRFDAEDTDGLKAFLRSVFRELQNDIKILFDPDDEYSIIMPSLKALRECIRALNEDIPESAFKEPELIGWVYQYFQTEEKNRVFEEVRTKKKKIQGDDIVPATSLYTERYMVDYLVQNSLGAIWMEMYPDSKLCEKWPYFVKDQDLKPREPRPVKSLTFLDPACGSGHFLLVAFDLFVQMYEEESRLAQIGKIPKDWVAPKEKIATTILESNLHGIDIDLRSVQLSWLVLYLRMREHQDSCGAPKTLPRKVNLVAADASLLNTPEFISWCEERFKQEPYAINIIKGITGRLRNLPEIGSLAKPEEDLKELIRREKERLLSAWKKEKQPQQEFLFKELLTPAQKELPYEKITDEQFWDGVLRRITKALDEYYRKASERGDTRAQVMAHEASKGFGFLELCNKRYDVVATNPPYMGSKNMGNELKEYVQSVYPEGKRDLYAAFIQRNREWLDERGIVAMVTQQSWMFLRSFAKMRESIFRETSVQTAAHLGPGGFSEISGEVVNCILFTIENFKLSDEHRFVAFNLTDLRSPRQKDECLIQALSVESNSRKFNRKQILISKIPEAPFSYWIPETFSNRLADSSTYMKEILFITKGIRTRDDKRFVRMVWEISNFERWVPFSKGGSYFKWFGNDRWMIDWKEQGEFLFRYIRSVTPPEKFTLVVRHPQYFAKAAWCYSAVCCGSLSLRFLQKVIATDTSPGIYLTSQSDMAGISEGMIACLLNSRIVTYFARALNPSSVSMDKNYIERIPIPNDITKNPSDELLEHAMKLKKWLVDNDMTEHTFNYRQLFSYNSKTILEFLGHNNKMVEASAAILHSIEALLDSIAFEMYSSSSQEQNAVIKDTGTPAGWYPLIKGYDTIPETDVCEIPQEVIEYLNNHERISPSEEELSRIKSRLRALYEAGPGAKVEDIIDEEESLKEDDEEAETLIGKRIPIPTETFLEELSVKMEIHPISIYWLLKELREKEGVVCWPEAKRYVEDYFTVIILRMLGFRWPKQIEADEPIPEWADKDGIIPITEHTGEQTLLERIRDRIGAEFGEDRIGAIETEFSDILYNAACKEAEIKGKKPPRKRTTLSEWLEKEFFKRHISQFKKRPIAWHISSSNGTFQVLLFYHKLSGDILRNLKNRYLAKVRQFYGVLLEKARGGESTHGGLTLGKLQDIEAELEDFASRLDRVINLPYEPLIDDGVRVNIAPLQKVGLLKYPVLSGKDVDRAIADRNRWREDDREQMYRWELNYGKA
jgi:hypothetical protein